MNAANSECGFSGVPEDNQPTVIDADISTFEMRDVHVRTIRVEKRLKELLEKLGTDAEKTDASTFLKLHTQALEEAMGTPTPDDFDEEAELAAWYESGKQYS